MKKVLSFLFLLCITPLMTFAQITISQTTALRSEDEARTIEAYKRANEAVVFIATKTLSVDPFEMFPEVKQAQGSGSGIIIDAQRALVVTNLHVIQEAQKIEISLADGSTHGAKLVGYDRELDVALLQLRNPPERLVSLEFGDSGKLEVGQRVLAIGNPFGLNRTLTAGIISSLNRSVKSPQGALMKGLIQTDAAINPGNSGGALLDADGRLIGINTAILSQSGDSAGIGFAVPIVQIKRVLPELIATGKVRRPTVGWILDDTNAGVMVRWLERGSPAEKAGIIPAYKIVTKGYLRGYMLDYANADFIIAAQGKPVRSRDEVEELLSILEPGVEVELLLRSGNNPRSEERKVRVMPERR